MNNLEPVFIREEVVKATRDFFYQKKFHEFIPSVLNEALPLEPHLYAFSTKWKTTSSTKELYLSTSPESGLKKMLAKGIGDCFAIEKSFRNLEGSGTLHSPEFLMLEWYREDVDYRAIMKDVQEFIIFVKKRVDKYLKREQSNELRYQNQTVYLEVAWPVFSIKELFKTHAGLDFEEILQDEALIQKAKEKGYVVEDASWAELFDQILVNEIEPSLPKIPFFITDFPTRISPLCTPQKKAPYLAERFEVYLFGMELGNGNTEITDSDAVRRSFLEEQEHRKRSGLASPPIDEEFLMALKNMSSKSYAGIGLGIDRLAMIMADKASILETNSITSS